MRRFVPLLFWAVVCSPLLRANQSIALGGGWIGQFSSTPLKSTINSSFYIELRVHGWTQPATCQNIVIASSFQVRFCPDGVGGGPFQFIDNLDQLSDGAYLRPTAQDFVVRLHRDLSRKQLIAEIWNANGASYVVSTGNILNPNAYRASDAPGQFGDQNISLNVAYCRWFLGTIATGGRPPSGSSGGDLADWEFEGNLDDSSGAGLQISSGSPPVFVPTPAYAPGCSAGVPQAFRASTAVKLDGTASYPLDGGDDLTFFWSLAANSTQRITWSSQSAPQPQLFGVSAGPLDVTLTVTQGDGQHSSCSVSHGAVNAAVDDVVLVSNPAIASIVGPMLRWGSSANPWPWFDDRAKFSADFFGPLLSTQFVDWWNTPSSNGTISIASGSAQVNGQGTHFLSDVCGGIAGAPPAATNIIVIWYQIPQGWPGAGTGRMWKNVASCSDDTHLTLVDPIQYPVTQTSLNYVIGAENGDGPNSLAIWNGGSSNANYYDNALAYFTLYSRTGMVVYLNYFHMLADRWWNSPIIDQGNACSHFDRDGLLEGRYCSPARYKSLTGLVLRALEDDDSAGLPGSSPKWAGLRTVAESTAQHQNLGINPIYDVREEAYETSWVCLMAAYDYDPDHRATYRGYCASAIENHWLPARQSNGEFVQPTGSYSSWNGAAGSISVVTGSTHVTGIGTNWNCTDASTWNSLTHFWVGGPQPQNQFVPIADSQYYLVASCDGSASLTLASPYQGSSKTGYGWSIGPVTGRFAQPFIQAVLGASMAFAYTALKDDPAYADDAAAARNLVVGVANWITNPAFGGARGETGGLWYVRDAFECEPNPDSPDPLHACTGDSGGGAKDPGDIQASRFLQLETFRALSQAYLLQPSLRLKTSIDALFGAAWGGFGGPGSDANYLFDYFGNGSQASYDFAVRQYAKDQGFCCGWGGGAQWPAARIAGLGRIGRSQ